jgi:hypothetical protein
LDAAGYFSVGGGGDHVDLAADAEFAGEVDAGFDGEAGVGEEDAGVVGFEVVEVGAGAVDVGADVVAGAVGEPTGVSGVADDGAGGVVGLVAGDGRVSDVGCLDGRDGGVAGAANGGEDGLFALGGFAVHDAGPCDVVVDGAGLRELGPEVDEDEVSAADGAGVFGGGLVVRVGGVGTAGDVGAVFPDEAFAAEGFADPGDHGEFVSGGGANQGAHLLPGFGEDAVDFLLGDVVGGDLVVGEDGFELADKVGGADDFLAHLADAFDGSGVDHGDVHDGVAWRVLHGDAGVGGEHGFERGVEFLPGGVFGAGAGEGVEAGGLDAVDEFAGFAGGGDEVIPAAGDVHAGIQAEDAVGEGVAVVMVVEEPGVEVGVAERGLDGGDVHGENSRPVGGKSESRLFAARVRDDGVLGWVEGGQATAKAKATARAKFGGLSTTRCALRSR